MINKLQQTKGTVFRPLFYCIQLLRSFLFFIFPLIPPLRKRITFERKNLTETACRSFAEEKLSAQCAFEISSEGELEQAHPLIERVLERGGRVEILFASPSVEKKCQDIYEQNRERVRILRMPLLSYFPWKWGGGQNIEDWLTAPVLILCRYDFYPELFLYGMREGRQLLLISAALQNKSRCWAPLYRHFDKIVCSNEGEKQRFLDWKWPSEKLTAYEFRSVRILSRLESRGKVLARWHHFISWMGRFPQKHRLIVGNAWPAEMAIFQSASLQQKVNEGKLLVVIVPHKTDANFVQKLEESMEDLSVHILSRTYNIDSVLERWQQSPGPLIFNVSGILLEFYTLFQHALVGGGHGKGVHSLLEPFLAGCSVLCGPNVERSSEYDFLQETSPKSIRVVSDWKKLPGWESMENGFGLNHFSNQFETVITWLLESEPC